MKIQTLPIRWLAIVLLSAAVILPQSLRAQDFTPDMFPGQSPDRTSFVVSATVNVGDFGKCPNTKSFVTAISSSDESVVKVYNENYYSAVLMVGVGTADVTYTETMFSVGENGIINPDGPSTTHTIHYTVKEGIPTAYWEYQGEPVTTYRVVWQGQDWGAVSSPEPRVIVKDLATDRYGQPYMQEKWVGMMQLSFESSNPEVATVSMRGVSPVGYGKATITCTWPGTVLWEPVSISYEVSVEAPKQNVYVNFYQTEVTGFVGESMSALPNVQMLTIDRWQSENPEVASVDEQTGQVSFLSKGTTRIFAYVNETEEHYAATGYYTVTVKKRTPEFSFSESVAYGEPNVPFTHPALNNPNNLPIDKWGCSDTKVAEIDEATGEVTVKAVGDAFISCESFGNETYEAATASYMLHVTNIDVRVMGIEVTSLNADDILGDGSKKVTFDKQTRTLTLNNWMVDATGIGDPNVRTRIIWNHSKEPLVINPIGECSIINADGCIVSMSGALIFMSESKDGKLTLTANETTQSIAVQANAVKVHECDVTAIGSVVGMKLGELTVSRQSHIYAEATGANAYAGLVCSKFVIADEGIQILTPGVHYEVSKNGFFDDEKNTVASKVVEIGKVPVTVPDKEETIIQFNLTSPDESESVVFSSSANDTFNEETGQLEISTSLTDEQVATALETLIPGSSAWMAMLPGSLVLDIPSGKGTILVNCLTLPGYTLNIMIEGQGTVSITQATFDWAMVSYDVATPTHVVIYLHAISSSVRALTAPLKGSQNPVGAYIKAVAVTPDGVATTIDVIEQETPGDGKNQPNGKYMMNGKLRIVRNGHVYDVTGIEVK